MSLFLTQAVSRAELVDNPIFFTVSSPGDLVVGLLNESSRRYPKPPRLLSRLTGTVEFRESGTDLRKENKTNGENLIVQERVDRREPSSHCSKSKGRSKSRDNNRVKRVYCGKDGHMKNKCFKRTIDEKLRKQDTGLELWFEEESVVHFSDTSSNFEGPFFRVVIWFHHLADHQYTTYFPQRDGDFLEVANDLKHTYNQGP
ncbi:hypothetical protein M9H77_25286 [Catharanthus roseus]|uniref:Uncharacterized protein n=1 Tax=Catharanthus roseus TaxID=4058 RepID=A0ACC0A916_CATRO|nr:hypothetical protein M9H77_25286 [Catharanthus roseus]